MSEKIPGLRSPFDKVNGVVYFGRMIDKIRLHAAGKLPQGHVPSLGNGFDERCTRLLRISYQNLKDHVLAAPGDEPDETLLEWAFNQGRQPEEDDIEVWNSFMTKRGWKDEITPRLNQRKAEGGFSDRADIETVFQYIDADEERS